MSEPGKKTIFRDEALAKLDSLDELDKLVTVTRPRAWLVLGVIGLLILTALVWSMAGRLTTTVDGWGILLRGGRSLRVVSDNSGQVAEMLVKIGDIVSVGKPVATLSQPALELAARGREAVVSRLRRRADRLGTVEARDALAQAEAALTATRRQLSEAATVLSSYSGLVASLQVYAGQYLNRGSPVITVEPAQLPLVATLFVTPGVGKEMQPGMQVQIVPANASVEEYGYLLGTVTYVAEMPSTPESMMAVLQNELLVAQFSAAGPPLRAEVSLQRQPANPSGYEWSSSQGPPYPISSGTACTARVILSSDPPITRVFPSLAHLFGSGD